jgi:hypothetical protein
MTNPAHLSGPRHLDNFIATPNPRPLIGTLQKHMTTLTRTATNQTAGPLACTRSQPHNETIGDSVFAVPSGQFFHDMTIWTHLAGLFHLEKYLIN